MRYSTQIYLFIHLLFFFPVNLVPRKLLDWQHGRIKSIYPQTQGTVQTTHTSHLPFDEDASGTEHGETIFTIEGAELYHHFCRH